MNSENTHLVYSPFKESSARFSIPVVDDIPHQRLWKKMNTLFTCINAKWDIIKKLIDDNYHIKNWNATSIQSLRYEIHLSFDKNKTNELGCWTRVSETLQFPQTDMDEILDYAKKQAIIDLGKEMADAGEIATPALILCDNNQPQNFHLDIMGDKRKQYGMLLSHKSTTTIVGKTNSPRMKTLKDVTKVLSSYTPKNTKRNGSTWMNNWHDPSQELLRIIESIGDEETSVTDVKAGYSELFRFMSPPEDHPNEDFEFESIKVEDCPTGTFYSVNGGEIHAGSGASHDQVRVFLFWTYHDLSLEPYDNDEQVTKLSLIINIARDCWEKLKKLQLRREMIFLIYYTYLTCELEYRNTCRRTFRNYPDIESMIKEFPELPKRYSTPMPATCLPIVTKYAKKTDLFHSPEPNEDED